MALKTYLGWTQKLLKAYADLETRFSSYNTKAEGLIGDSVADDRAALNTLVNVTMQPNGGWLDVIGVPRLASAITIPSNVTLRFVDGAFLAPDGGVLVTMNGHLAKTRRKVFGGGGSFTFGANISKFLPQWWGALGDAVNDDTAAIQAAINASIAAGGRTHLPGVSRYYATSATLTAMLAAAQTFAMSGDGLRSLIYSTAAGDILVIDGSGVPTGRTVPRLSDFCIAGSAATQDGIVLNYTHRGTITNVFVIACGRWAWNFKACFLNSMHGGGAANNVGAPGNIPTQPIPKGMLRLGDGSQGGGSNANSFHGCCFSGSQKPATPITGATFATPIVITSVAHGMATGDVTGIIGVTGNTNANGAWIVTVVDADHFSLQGSVGNAAYVNGGTSNCGVGIHIQATTNSYANSFYGGSAENNAVGALFGPLCTLNTSIALDFTTSYAIQYQDRGANNNFLGSGSGGGATQIGGTLNMYGAIQLLGASAYFQLDPTVGVRFNKSDASHNILRVLDNRDVIVGDGAIATNATGGFLMISGGAGPPTGVPTNAGAGILPVYYDTTNNFLYVYNGGWKKSTVYA